MPNGNVKRMSTESYDVKPVVDSCVTAMSREIQNGEMASTSLCCQKNNTTNNGSVSCPLLENEQLPLINAKQALELLECPVCLDCMVPPIYQCREGHALCSECLRKVKSCPTCRSSPIDIRCRALDRLADSVGDVSCRYASLGCMARIRYRLKKDHEERCQFKYFQCLHAEEGCKYEGTMENLVNHLVSCHDYEEIQSQTIHFCCNSRTLRTKAPLSADQQCVWQRHIYHCYDKYFVLRVHRRTDADPSIYISLVVIHWKHHSNRYCIETQGNHRKYSFGGKSHVTHGVAGCQETLSIPYIGPVWSVRKGFKEVERVRDCLILPENIALFLSGRKGSETDLSLINLTVMGIILP